jgi:phosphatidylserine/phosphatidylglycerophosphate/cardiolipin synthase-like enzyme
LLLDTLNRLDQLIASEKEFDAFKSKNSGVRFLGEKQIKSTVLGLLKNAKGNTEIDIAMFYLSDRKVIRAIKSALKKGAQVRLLLDQNLNAFGFKKNGIPNRAVADELMSLDASNALSIRWASADSRGQFHPKAFRLYDDKNDILIVGSANFTRRNINGFNLEACLLFNSVLSVSNKFDAYFDEVWTNSLGYSESLDYSELNNPNWMRWYRAAVFRIQEWTQLSTY